jgi:hypothetical protein
LRYIGPGRGTGRFLSQYNEVRFYFFILHNDRLCGLVVRVPGYGARGPGFDCRRYQIFGVAVGVERGPLSLVRINEEFLEGKVVALV